MTKLKLLYAEGEDRIIEFNNREKPVPSLIVIGTNVWQLKNLDYLVDEAYWIYTIMPNGRVLFIS